jgi:hypothetical protein
MLAYLERGRLDAHSEGMTSLVHAAGEALWMVMERLNPGPTPDPYDDDGAHAHGGDEGGYEDGQNAGVDGYARRDGARVYV